MGACVTECEMKERSEIRNFFFFRQKTAYEVGTGDWSSDVCSSDLCSTAELDALLPHPKQARLRESLSRIATGELEPQQIGRASCRERV